MSNSIQDERNEADPGAQALHLARRASRYWKEALALLLVGAAITAFFVVRARQVYRSEAVVLYRQVGRQAYGDVESSRRVGSRLEDMLKARERLAKLVQELDLYPEIGNPEEAVAEMLKVVGFRARDGSTFVVSFDGRDPKAVQETTRRLADTLIEDTRRLRSDEANVTQKLLNDELTGLREELKRKEEALEAFLKANPDLAPMDPLAPMMMGGEGDVEQLQQQLAQLQAQQAAAASAGTGATVSAGPSPELVAAVRRAELEQEQAAQALASMRASFTEVHPSVVAAQQRVREAEQRLKEAQRVLATSQPAGRAAAARGADPAIAAAIAEVQGRISRARRAQGYSKGASARQAKLLPLEVKRQSLQRDVEEVRERLRKYEDQQFTASVVAKMESSGEAGTLSVLSPAYLPAVPVVDTKKKVAIIGLAAALFLAVLLAVIRALSDDRIFERTDIVQMTSSPVLVVVPRARVRRDHG